jgi:hypothetical protein
MRRSTRPSHLRGAALRNVAAARAHCSRTGRGADVCGRERAASHGAHALLATVNRLLGSYTLMIAVPVGALFTSSVFINVSSMAALSVAAAHAGPGQAAAEPR